MTSAQVIEFKLRRVLQQNWLSHAHPDAATECPCCGAEMTVRELETHGPDCPAADLRHVTFEAHNTDMTEDEEHECRCFEQRGLK